jgi:hypothetical protein
MGKNRICSGSYGNKKANVMNNICYKWAIWMLLSHFENNWPSDLDEWLVLMEQLAECLRIMSSSRPCLTRKTVFVIA